MIYCEQVKGRGVDGPAYVIRYRTPMRSGNARFGSRAKATAFAIGLLQELQARPTSNSVLRRLDFQRKQLDN